MTYLLGAYVSILVAFALFCYALIFIAITKDIISSKKDDTQDMRDFEEFLQKGSSH